MPFVRRSALVLGLLLARAALAEVPPELAVPVVVQAAVSNDARQRLLLSDERPPPEALPYGTIALSDKVHLIPIRLYPVKAGLHETVAIEVDIERGLRPLRLELAGTGILGGAEGEMNLGKLHKLHGTVLNTPNMILVSAEDTMEFFRVRLSGNRQLSAGLRAGMQVWNLPNLIIAEGYAQAGARLDGLLDGNRLVHLDAFAGSGAVMNFNTLLDQHDRLSAGLEVSAALVVEK
jgi:hypothetical protein